MSVIDARGVVKTFGTARALDGLDLQVNQGDVHGFLGPNGAGKSTTIRVLLGLMRRDCGAVTVFGRDPWEDAVEVHRRIAYVPGDVDLWPSLTGGEVIDLIGRMRGGVDPRRRDELIERFELDPSKRCRTYSKGNRQKVALVAAFSGRADLFLLDEPSSGLDPLMEIVFQEVVAEACRGGATVLLSSHILSEVERLADRVSIVRKGRVVQNGTLGELRHLTSTVIDAVTERTPDGIDRIAGVAGLEIDDRRVRFRVEADHLGGAIGRLTDAGLVSITCQPPTLEELMLRHYGDDPASADGEGADGPDAARGRADGDAGRTPTGAEGSEDPVPARSGRAAGRTDRRGRSR